MRAGGMTGLRKKESRRRRRTEARRWSSKATFSLSLFLSSIALRSRLFLLLFSASTRAPRRLLCDTSRIERKKAHEEDKQEAELIASV